MRKQCALSGKFSQQSLFGYTQFTAVLRLLFPLSLSRTAPGSRLVKLKSLLPLVWLPSNAPIRPEQKKNVSLVFAEHFRGACVYSMRKRWLNSIKRKTLPSLPPPTPHLKYFFKLFFFFPSSIVFFSYALLLQTFFYLLKIRRKNPRWTRRKQVGKIFVRFSYCFWRTLWMYWRRFA